MPEFELKFQVPAEREAAVEAALRRGTSQQERLQARYYDTAEGSLAARQLVLRLRREGGRWVQAAKGPGQVAFERMEHEVLLPARARPEPDLARHAEEPVGRCLREALGAGHGPLQCVLETDIVRLSRKVGSGGSSVEIAFDRGELRAQGRSLPVREIEFELKQGSAGAVVELAARWCEQHGLWLDPLSKFGAGRRLAAGDESAPATSASPLRLEQRTAAAYAAATLRSALVQALANGREVASGSFTDAHVHQLRVGLRRLRTVMRELEPLVSLAELRAQVEPPLGDLFHTLGRHRDLSTLLPRMVKELAGAGGPAVHWQPKLPDVASAARSAPVQAAWLQLVAMVARLEATPEEDAGTLKEARRLVGQRLARLHRHLLGAGRHFAEWSPEERHTARKRLKRLRYLAELAGPLYPRHRVRAFIDGIKPLQDALGAYQDDVVARGLYEERAAEEAHAWFAAGWLAAREPEQAATCAKACRKAAKIETFWD